MSLRILFSRFLLLKVLVQEMPAFTATDRLYSLTDIRLAALVAHARALRALLTGNSRAARRSGDRLQDHPAVCDKRHEEAQHAAQDELTRPPPFKLVTTKYRRLRLNAQSGTIEPLSV